MASSPPGASGPSGPSGPSGAGTPALAALLAAGITHTAHAYDLHDRVDPRSTAYGVHVAAALGIEPARLLKTLVVQADDALVLAVVPVAGTLDTKALAAAVGAKRAALADLATAERSTGSVRGGISPLGARRALPVVVDASALDHATVLCSAGRRGLQVELAPADLVRAAGATVATIARPG